MSGLSLIPVVAIFAIFYFMVIRPNGRRQRELSNMQESLSLGDAVVLTSGIFGTISRVDEDRVGVEISDGVTITVAKGAIGIVNPPVVPPTSSSPDHLEIDRGADGADYEEKN